MNKDKLIFLCTIIVVIFTLAACNKNKETSAAAVTDNINQGSTENDTTLTEVETDTDAATEVITTEKVTEEVTTIDNKNRFIADEDKLSKYSNESSGWGQGSVFDEFNRPLYSVDANVKYKDLDAYYIMGNKKKLYLTMDCGSGSGFTNQILDTLKEKGVKITFFVTKDFAVINPEIIERMVEEGHIIGNHSVTHPFDGMPSLSIKEQINEVRELHDYIDDLYGFDMYLFRYPRGIFSEQSLALMQDIGYKSIFWSFTYLDYDEANQPDEAETLEKLKNRIHPGAIFLLHVGSSTNANILADFIEEVIAAGYTFEIIKR